MNEQVRAVRPPHHRVDRAARAAAESDLRQVLGAIAMVAAGWAVDVVLCGLHGPESAVADAEREGRAAGVRLRLDRDAGGHVSLVVGPREV